MPIRLIAEDSPWGEGWIACAEQGSEQAWLRLSTRRAMARWSSVT